MEIRVLGPLEVVTGHGPPLRLGGPQQRAVLGILALRVGEVVPVPTLVEALWPGAVPRSATNVVHTYMSRLRRILGDAKANADANGDGDGNPVGPVRRPAGYVLDAGPEHVDARRFEQLVATARAEADAGDLAAAVATHRRALDLWRGEVLADLPDLQAVRHDASRLDQLRLTAVEHRLDAELALGRHAALVAELTALTESHPFRERFWAQLMLALYRSGRQAEALAAYRRVRDLLVDQFGIEPGPELQALERDVLHHDVDPAPPERPMTGRGRGRGGGQGNGSAPARVPLPTTLAHPAHDRPLAGRARERAALDDAYDVARSGHFAAVFVGGPPGIGKTALATWWARRAHAAGATVVMGRADETSPAPFRPLGEAIGHWARHRPPGRGAGSGGGDADRLHRLDERDLRLLAHLAPRLHPAGLPPTPAPGHGVGGDDRDRLRLFDATARWVEELAAAAGAAGAPPPVVLLDDLQWADVATLLAVRHLLRHPPDAGALLVVTHRDVDLPEGHGLLDLLAGVHGDGPARRLVLAGLEAADVVDLLDATPTTGDRDRERLAAELVRVTGGNPLFVHETVRYLGERGGLTAGDGTLRLDGRGVPTGVKEVVERRLRRLPAATTAVLRRAGVLGERVERPLLARLVDQPELALVEALEPAVAAGLLVAGGDRWSFAHALVREAIVDGLGLADRARTHWRAGLLLADLAHGQPPGPAPGGGADLPGIARHLTAGVSAGDVGVAVAANVRAGEAALATLAFEEALDDFTTALDLLGRTSGTDADPDLQFRAWHGLGQAAALLADRGRQREGYLRAAEVARAHGGADRLASAVTGFVGYVGTASTGTSAADRHDEARADELLHDALALVGDEPSVQRSTLLALATVRAMTSDRAPEARAAANAALASARVLGHPATLAHAEVTYRWSRLGSPLDPALEDAPRRLLAFDWPAEDRVGVRVFVLPVLPTAALQRGDRLTYEAIRAGVADDPETWRSAHLQSYLRMWDGALALADGRFDEARRLAASPVPGAEGWGAWASAGMVQRIVAGIETGDPSAGPRLEMFLTASARPRPPAGLAMAANVAVSSGDVDRALAHLDELRARPLTDELGWAAPLVLRHLAEAVVRLTSAVPDGDRWGAARAAELLPLASGYDGQMLVSFTATTVDGAGARLVGQLLLAAGRLDEAVDRLRAGRDLERAFRADALAARTSFWLARALLARGGPGDAGEARAVARGAVTAADRMGMALLGRDLRLLLRTRAVARLTG